MSDVSVSNAGGSGDKASSMQGFNRTGAAFGVAFLLILVLHSYFEAQLGQIYIWVATAVVMIGAAYFVAQGQGSATAAVDEDHMTDLEGQINAIKKSQAVIEFNLDGTIITANDNFLTAMGYEFHEVQGKHHRLFVEPEYAESADYRAFWSKLGHGEYEAGEFKRIGKDGQEVWIQASYNPIFDRNGNPFKVVKYASDVTAQVQAASEAKEVAKLKAALDGANVNVMIADNDFNIMYMNESMVEMMQVAEPEIKQALPHFNANSLLGTNIDQFHKNPAYQRGLVGEITDTFVGRINIGVRTFDLIANPIMEANGERFGTSVEWSDVTEQLAEEKAAKEVTAENSRIKSALDGAQTNVMLADNDFNIIYMNESMVAMMQHAESDIKKDLPNFDANSLMGTNIDLFHKDPSHQRNIIGGLTDTFDGRIEVGGRTFDLIANPVHDKTGHRIGTSVEWADITDRLAKERAAAAIATENSRIKTALDGTQTNVMLADDDYNIIYMNESMVATMQNAEADLKKELANFNASSLIGQNIDVFHKNPAHQRGVLDKLDSTYETSIVVGGRTFVLIANPVAGENGTRIGTSVEWSDVTEKLIAEKAAKAEADANAQVKQALDKVTANVMVAGADMKISYMNEAMQRMFKIAEADIQKVLPGFESSKLIGANPDVFHKNPAHQRGMIESLSAIHSTEISVGSRKFTLIANPVNDSEGNRLGTVVEWGDVTAERAVEDEIGNVVDAAVAGDLTQRINLEGKEGFLLNVSKGINDFASTCDAGLSDVATMLATMAAGDLTARITNEYQGTFNDLKQNSNETANKLSEVMAEIMKGAGEVSNAATEISDGSNDLSQRTEQQASSLEETAAAMEEMEGAVKTNADNAAQANRQGSTARTVAEKGGEVVNDAVGAMSRIEESSQKISDIIVVIDEIAFQTNLLALNAAVEAARAGDAGKGFAVVASEVRALAQRSSEAAKDIKGLIVDSNNQVKDGVELVNEAGQQLGEIVASIGEVTSLVSEIASANQEQATGIAEINRAIAEMDEMTQQNSALVEETAASARTLEEQSEVMADRVSFFNTGDEIASAVSKPRSRERASTPAPKKPRKSKPAASSSVDDDWAEF